MDSAREAGCVYRIHFCARRVARDVKWRTLDGSRLQTLRVPCNFFSSPFPLTPCIAAIPSFYFSPLPLRRARQHESDITFPRSSTLLRLRRTLEDGGKSEINRESTINNRGNERFVVTRIFDFLFLGHVSFLSLSLSLSFLISSFSFLNLTSAS